MGMHVMTLEKEIRSTLLKARDGFVDRWLAAKWLVQYPTPREFGSATDTVAFLTGAGHLNETLTERYGPVPMVDLGDKCFTPGTRPDNQDSRLGGNSVSIELVRATAKRIGHLELLELFQEIELQKLRILGTEDSGRTVETPGQPAAASSPDLIPDLPVRTRWQVGLYNLLPEIIRDTGKRDVTTVLHELRKRGARFGISKEHGQNVYELRWMDGADITHDVQKITLSNTITKAHKWLKQNGHIHG
jgi:hypothetical protein